VLHIPMKYLGLDGDNVVVFTSHHSASRRRPRNALRPWIREAGMWFSIARWMIQCHEGGWLVAMSFSFFIFMFVFGCNFARETFVVQVVVRFPSIFLIH
jgi:hypothetical protein